MGFRFRKAPFLILAALIATLVLTHAMWLSALGAYLIQADQPAKADYAVVLAGDHTGRRLIMGAELVRNGFVRKAIVDGPQETYGFAECDLAVFEQRTGASAQVIRDQVPYTWDPDLELQVDFIYDQELVHIQNGVLQLAQPVPAEQMVDESFVRAAQQALGKLRS